MAEFDSVPPETLQQLDRIGSADIVVGFLSGREGTSDDTNAAMVRSAVDMFSPRPRTVVLRAGGVSSTPAAEGQSDDSVIHCVSCAPLARDTSVSIVEGIARAYRAVFAITGRLSARACAVIASDLSTAEPRWIAQLTEPILRESFDLIAPCYSRRKFEGLINSAFVYPLIRALYGKQIENPMGPDFGFSGPLAALVLKQDAKARSAGIANIIGLFSTEAVCGEFRICQTHLGLRVFPPADWTNLSSLLAEVLGPLFMDMERRAPYWQKVRGSQPVTVFGDPMPAPAEAGGVDIKRLLESFQLGCRSLMEVWSMVLPPSTLLEIQKLGRMTAAQFTMNDAIWARVVYDFALGYRTKTISRDHLLRAITPLYLGWVTSWVLDLENAPAEAAEARVEALALAFETEKPYLLSRWRWPDRFNP